jgi:hypothetical protein
MDSDLKIALSEFAWAFEQVFHHDWAYTDDMLLPANGMIAAGGTFLEPGVEDESEDWGHRAMLLARYRTLLAPMKSLGLVPAKNLHLNNA